LIEIYTDGAYNPVSGRGGWAAVAVEEGHKRVFSGMVERTTGNRMEVTAALEGILHTPQNSEIVVYTDSQYLFGCMAKGWQRRANRDLWEQLDKAVKQRKVRWEWIDQSTANLFHNEAHTTANNLTSPGKAARTAPSEKEQAKAPPTAKLSHLDERGRPRMVDISAKADTQREAIAKGRVRMQPVTFELIKRGRVAKGDVLTAAQLAGIMAAKQTANLIPLCHPLLLGNVKVELALDEANSAIDITATVKSTGKTGVEMEALTATAVAALTIYDMCKAVDRGMQIESIRLARKSGGKSGTIELESI